MTQIVPATAVLGPGLTGLAIGLRVLNIDGTEYAAFSTTSVAETSTAGTYRKASGVSVPDAGGYIVWGTALVDYAESTVDSVYGLITGTKNTLDSLSGADGDTLKTLSDQIDGVGTGITAQAVRDAMKLAPTAGAPAAGSVDAHLDTLITDVGAIDPSVQLSAAVASAVNSGDLAISTHHALAQTITSTSANDLSARVLVLAVKQYDTDADSAAILLISTDTGLEYVAGAAYATPAHGSLTVSGSAGAWEIAAALDGTATALLTPYAVHSYPAELKDLTSDTAVWTGLALIGRGLVQMLS